jgi:RepB DNA-primase from phage plasmid
MNTVDLAFDRSGVPMGVPIEPREALSGYLQAIVGREPPASLLELRPMLAGGGAAPERAFLPVGELGEVERRVQALAPTRHVYVGVAPRTRPEGHAGAVTRCWVLWIDADTEAALDRLRSFAPSPGLVVRSGSGGAHAYWPLHEPLAPGHAQRANRRLALALGADMQATDAARILRPPGTLNHKATPPRPVVCTRLEPVRFTAAEVVGRLPDSAHYRRPARSQRPPLRHGAAHPERILDRLARTVASAQHGNRNSSLFWASCRALEHVASGDLDEHQALDALATAALEAGLGGDEIKATIRSAFVQRRREAA